MKRLFDLVELAIEAVSDQERWIDLTNALSRHFDLRSAVLFKSPLPGQQVQKFFVSDFLVSDEGRPIVDQFASGGDASDKWVYEKFLTAPALKLVTEESFIGVECPEDMPFCTERELMRSHAGINARLAGVLNEQGPWRDALALHSYARSEEVPASVFSEMNLILPTIGRAMVTHRAFATLKQNFGAHLGALDFLEFGAAVLDEAGEILYCNSYAAEVFADRDGMTRLANNKLEFSESAVVTEFHDLLAGAVEPYGLNARKSALRMSVARKSAKEPYFIQFHAIRDQDNEADMVEKIALLFVIDPTRAGSLSDAGILELGLLTEAEKHVCELLLSGASTAEIAEIRDVSLFTVRYQVKAVLSKLRCRDRLHLYQVAFTTHLPIKKS